MSAAGAPTRTRVFAASLTTLAARRVVVVPLAPDAEARPREALLLRDDAGVPRAYRNLCRHLPVPLDAGSRHFLVAGQLQCATHGASYRLRDGVCTSGPCVGAALIGLEVECLGDELFVIDAGE